MSKSIISTFIKVLTQNLSCQNYQMFNDGGTSAKQQFKVVSMVSKLYYPQQSHVSPVSLQ